ncbi:S-adenosyl-L-methionine-dependent methyltransferase [Mycena vitilis]|nr:S-adenosyl-L-methionine-dependent methyltransferase [Mycena vitilis]
MSDPHHHHDFSSANQDFFDKHAHEVDHRPKVTEMAESICNALLEAYSFNQDATVVLDFACGTGVVARRLAPHCKTLVGVDISQGMVDEFNKGAQNHGIPNEQMRAMRADLKGDEAELEGMKFDVVMCSLAYHHIANIAAVTCILAFFLKPGGTLLVVDYPKMDYSGVPDAVKIIAHKGGISEAAIKEVYEGAGLGGFQCVMFKGPKTDNHPEDLFLAKGVKL